MGQDAYTEKDTWHEGEDALLQHERMPIAGMGHNNQAAVVVEKVRTAVLLRLST
jgi:hypothetical protein